MLKKKKAQGISINTIIIAAIAIVVLILLVLIFTGRIRVFRTSVEDCRTSLGGECVEVGTCTGLYEVDKGPANCPDGYTCCVRIKRWEE